MRLRQIAARSSWKRIWLGIFVLQRQREREAADRRDAHVGKLAQFLKNINRCAVR
jgi:hypothetical protein